MKSFHSLNDNHSKKIHIILDIENWLIKLDFGTCILIYIPRSGIIKEYNKLMFFAKNPKLKKFQNRTNSKHTYLHSYDVNIVISELPYFSTLRIHRTKHL